MTKKRARVGDLTGSKVFFSESPEDKDEKNEVVTETSPEPKKNKVDEKLVRATFYFYPDQLDQLEEIRLQLRKDYKIKTDKSSIVRTAITEVMNNYYDNKKDSILKNKLQSYQHINK